MIHLFCTGICTFCHCTVHSVVLAHIFHKSFSSGVLLTIENGFFIIFFAVSTVFLVHDVTRLGDFQIGYKEPIFTTHSIESARFGYACLKALYSSHIFQAVSHIVSFTHGDN
jgi:hypothetical protein